MSSSVQGMCKLTDMRDLEETRVPGRQKPWGWILDPILTCARLVEKLLTSEDKELLTKLELKGLLKGLEIQVNKLMEVEKFFDDEGLTRDDSGTKVRTAQQVGSAMFEVVRANNVPKKHRLTPEWLVQDIGVSGHAVAEGFLHNLHSDEKTEIIDTIVVNGLRGAVGPVVKMMTRLQFGVSATPAMYAKVEHLLPRIWHKWEVSSRAGMWAAIRRVIRQNKEEKFCAMTGASFLVS